MFTVKTRRRAAIFAVAVFLAVSVSATYLAARNYSGETLRSRAEEAFKSATGYSLSLGRPVVSVEDEITFTQAVVSVEGRAVITSGAVTVSGLPKPRKDWQPDGIEAHKIALVVGLDNPPQGLSSVAALANILEKGASLHIVLPDTFIVDAAVSDLPHTRYFASAAVFAEKGVLELAPSEGKAPAGWSFSVTPTQATLSANISDNSDPVAQSVVRGAGKTVLEKAENAAEGSFIARWDAEGQTVSFANPGGWRLPSSAATGLPVKVPEGDIAVRVTAFTVKNGAVTSLDATVDYSAPKVTSSALSQLLGLVGISALSGQGVPPLFENVHASVDLSMRDGVIAVKPVAGKPALIWAEAAGRPIPLVTASGQATLASLSEKAPE